MRRYRIVKKLGDGSQGVAYLAFDTQTNTDIVLKKVPAGSKDPDELNHSKTLRHPNIISCMDSFTENDFLYMVLTYAEGGDIESYLQLLKDEKLELPIGRACRWFSQLASALQYCHDHHTLHRDVKPSNVFLDKALDTVYLGDFGVAKKLDGKGASTSTFVGSPVWLSPEVISGQPYSYASDAWGLGCVLYELVAGYSPFDTAGNLASLVMKICAGDYEPLPTTVPEYVRKCVQGLLTVDTRKRWTIRQALDSCDEFRDAATLVDVSAAPTPRGGTYVERKPLSSRTSLSTSAAPQAVVVPSLAGPSQQRGLNTWVRGLGKDMEELEKQLAPVQNNNGTPATNNKYPVVAPPHRSSLSSATPSASTTPPIVTSSPETAGNRAALQPPPQAQKGLNTWVKGMGKDFEELERQLMGAGSGGSGGSSSALVNNNRTPQPAPTLAALKQPAPTANNQNKKGTSPTTASPLIAGSGGFARQAPLAADNTGDVRKWVKAKERELSDLEAMLGRYNNNNVKNNLASPPVRREQSPQRSNDLQQKKVAAPTQSPPPQPLTAQQERFRKAQAAADAKQKKIEEEQKARAEAEAKAKLEKEREAAVQAAKEARMNEEKKEREEKREREWREFRQKMKEGRREVAEHGGIQHDIVVGAAPAVAGRRAVGGALPSAPATASGGGGSGSARLLNNAGVNPVVQKTDSPYIAYGRRQSPSSLAPANFHSPQVHSALPPAPEKVQLVGGTRPSSGPTTSANVPTPTAPRSNVSKPIAVASLQQQIHQPPKNQSPSAAHLKSPVKGRPANNNHPNEANELDKHQAAIEKRMKQREELKEMMQKDRQGAHASGGGVNVEIVLPSNLRNLAQNKF